MLSMWSSMNKVGGEGRGVGLGNLPHEGNGVCKSREAANVVS